MLRYAGLIVVLFTAAAASAGQQAVFRAGIDLVHFGVVVTDRSGAPIRGLTPDDFIVEEEGARQTIKHFAGGDPENAPPMHLGFMIDLSGSMAADIKDVRSAAIKFLDAVKRVQDITIVDFDTEIRIAQFGSDDPRLVEHIRARKPEGGWTAFYDALGVYLNKAVEQTGEKILVMYTDGGDTRSAINQGELLELLKASDVTVYAIGYLEHQPSSAKFGQQQILQRLATATGGQAFFPAQLKDVDKMYERILSEIASRYSFGYTSTDTRMDGKWRDVKIRIVRPDLKHAKIRTRAGYYAPYKPAK